MPIDPSIYASAQANLKPFDPMGSLQNAVGISNALQQNKLLQQHVLNAQAENPLIQANTANTQAELPLTQAHAQGAQQENQLRQGIIDATALIKNHVNPDGTIDYNGLRTEASKNPSAVLGMSALNQMSSDQNKLTSYVDPSGRTQTLAAQSANAMVNPSSGSNPLQQPNSNAPSQDDIDNYHGHTDLMLNKIDGLLGKKSPLDFSDVLDMSGDLIHQFGKSGGKQGMSAAEISKVLPQMSQGANGEPDDNSIRQDLMAFRNKVQGTKTAITSKFGAPSTAAGPASGTTNTPTLEGPAPGYIEQQTKRAGASQDRINQVRADSSSAPTVISNLDNIINLAGKIQTGAGQDRLNKIKGALISAGIGGDSMKDDVSTFQQLQKYLEQNVQFQGNANVNIPELNSLKAANPNDSQLPQTIKAVAQYAKAVQKGKILRETAMNQVPGIANNPEAEEQFNNHWNNIYDPSAVELSMLPAAEHDKFLEGKSDDQAHRIAQSYSALKQLGAFKNAGQ